MKLEQAGVQTVDFTKLTTWAGQRQAFALQVNRSASARLTSLTLEPTGFPAPKLETPADGMRLTDLALFFRWQQVKGAVDYEIEISRDVGFTSPKTLAVRSEVEWPYYLPTDAELPAPGTWFWRVRARETGRPGQWSSARRLEINADHTKKPVTFPISAARPLLTIEASRVKDLSKFTHTMPADLKPFVAINCHTHLGWIDYLKPLQAAGQSAFIRTHMPGPMSLWTPLATVEEIFQTYPITI
jgi:hypothetical protein